MTDALAANDRVASDRVASDRVAGDVAAIDAARWEKLAALQASVGKTDMIRNLLELYCQEVPRRAAQLREAIRAGDAENAVLAAHSLKGSSSNVGAERLRRLAAGMEKLVKAGELDAVASVLEDVEPELERLRAAAEEHGI